MGGRTLRHRSTRRSAETFRTMYWSRCSLGAWSLFRMLQRRQSSCRLSGVLVPPLAIGMMWSSAEAPFAEMSCWQNLHFQS